MQKHTAYGTKILPSKDFFSIARDIAEGHHEKWAELYEDGTLRSIRDKWDS